MSCKFGFKDKFGTGILKDPILDRLCEEEPDKTLIELVEIAQKRKASIGQSNEIFFL